MKMVLVSSMKLELCLFCLISLIAYSVGLHTSIEDIHNQLNDNQQQKKASGFVPMRGRKSEEEFSNSNADRSANNDKETLGDGNLELMRTLTNILKLNNNGNLEDQLALLDQTYGLNQPTNNGQLNLHHNDYAGFRRYNPMINQRLYSQQVTPFLGLMTRYGAPKRAGFVPMRGRKSDPNVLLSGDDEDDFSPYKRAGFLPMRGKKSSMELDDLESQFNQKRAFHALRG